MGWFFSIKKCRPDQPIQQTVPVTTFILKHHIPYIAIFMYKIALIDLLNADVPVWYLY